MRDMNSLTIYTDGGARGNPGPAAYGFVVYEAGRKIFEVGHEIGISTNNVAEYTGVLAAIQWLKTQNIQNIKVNFILDSELVVNQLSGNFKVKNPGLFALYADIKKLEIKLNLQLNFTAVRREFNKEADRMVNLALDHKA